MRIEICISRCSLGGECEGRFGIRRRVVVTRQASPDGIRLHRNEPVEMIERGTHSRTPDVQQVRLRDLPDPAAASADLEPLPPIAHPHPPPPSAPPPPPPP